MGGEEIGRVRRAESSGRPSRFPCRRDTALSSAARRPRAKSSDSRSASGHAPSPGALGPFDQQHAVAEHAFEPELGDLAGSLDPVEVDMPQRRVERLHRAGRWRSSGWALRPRGRAPRASPARARSCRRRAGPTARSRRRRGASARAAAPTARGVGFVWPGSLRRARNGQGDGRALRPASNSARPSRHAPR